MKFFGYRRKYSLPELGLFFLIYAVVQVSATDWGREEVYDSVRYFSVGIKTPMP